VTNGLKWLPHRQSDDIANVQQTELIYAILLQSVVKLPSVIPVQLAVIHSRLLCGTRQILF
jgi:hypothetical protein